MPKKPDTIKVVVVNPGKAPETKIIPNTLGALQECVGGFIELLYPWEDDTSACMYCNEEGKFNGMEWNRALYDESGDVYEIIAGPFIIVGVTDYDEYNHSLTEKQIKHYTEMYSHPEVFYRIADNDIKVLKI